MHIYLKNLLDKSFKLKKRSISYCIAKTRRVFFKQFLGLYTKVKIIDVLFCSKCLNISFNIFILLFDSDICSYNIMFKK